MLCCMSVEIQNQLCLGVPECPEIGRRTGQVDPARQFALQCVAVAVWWSLVEAEEQKRSLKGRMLLDQSGPI